MYKSFKQAKFYRKLSLYIFFLAIIPVALKKLILAVPIVILSIYFGQKYSCPYCGHKFDLRIPPDEIKHCCNCGEKL